MRASETLSRSYDAVGRIREIDALLDLVRGRVGGTSHGLNVKCDTNVILDPMRIADTFLYAEADMVAEKEWCTVDVDEARAVCRGASDEIGASAAKALELFYCDGMAAHEIAEALGYPVPCVEQLAEDGPAMLDSCDYGELLARGRGKLFARVPIESI